METSADSQNMVSTNKIYINLPPVFSNGKFTELPVDSSTIAFEDSNPTAPSSIPVAYCIPGIGDFRHSYRFLAPLLQTAGFRVITQDMRGVGDSGTEFANYSIESIANDIGTVLDACQITLPVVLFANSLSAASAITFAADHPQRVAAVVTLGGFFRDMPKDTFFRPISHLLFNRLWGQPVWVSAFKGFFVAPPADLSDYTAAVKAKMLSNCAHAGIIGTMIRATKEHAWAKIETVKAPVLLVMGSRDPDFKNPVEETNFVASHLNNSRLVEIAMVDEVGHYPHVEAPDKVAQVSLAFLKTVGVTQN
jgi:pimeloyl-ACP methyl ester carboxylesterase